MQIKKVAIWSKRTVTRMMLFSGGGVIAANSPLLEFAVDKKSLEGLAIKFYLYEERRYSGTACY
jgi:hypothetical protein